MNDAECFKDFWFANDDGYLSLYHAPNPSGDSDDLVHVEFIDAGDNLAELIKSAQEHMRSLTNHNSSD